MFKSEKKKKKKKKNKKKKKKKKTIPVLLVFVSCAAGAALALRLCPRSQISKTPGRSKSYKKLQTVTKSYKKLQKTTTTTTMTTTTTTTTTAATLKHSNWKSRCFLGRQMFFGSQLDTIKSALHVTYILFPTSLTEPFKPSRTSERENERQENRKMRKIANVCFLRWRQTIRNGT